MGRAAEPIETGRVTFPDEPEWTPAGGWLLTCLQCGRKERARTTDLTQRCAWPLTGRCKGTMEAI